VAFIRTFFGVSPLNDFLGGDQTVEQLQLRLMRHLQKIPSLLMIGRQWGFDATKIAINIKGLGFLEPAWLQAQNLPQDCALESLLDAVIKGMSLPELPKNVPIIAWTMCPEFSSSIHRATCEQVLRLRQRFKPASRCPRPALSFPKLRNVLRTLEIKEMQRNPGYVPLLKISATSVAISTSIDSAPSSSASRTNGIEVGMKRRRGRPPKRAIAFLDGPLELNSTEPAASNTHSFECTEMDVERKRGTQTKRAINDSGDPLDFYSRELAANPKLSIEWILGKTEVSCDLNIVFQEGIPVAAFLEDDQYFFLDLPFLYSVLPSMAAGEQLFVPLYIQKILLPAWYGRTFPLASRHLLMEYQVIALARYTLAPALAEYVRLVHYARLLGNEAFIECEDESLDEDPLYGFLEEFAGVNRGSLSTCYWSLKSFLRENEAKIAPLLMIGLQWGFEVQKIAQNIIGLLGFEDCLLEAVASGAVMPRLNPATVVSVHWSMHPVFKVIEMAESQAADRNYQIYPIVNYATRSGIRDAPRISFTQEERADKLTSIITALKQKTYPGINKLKR
jgi:hypothetical protein